MKVLILLETFPSQTEVPILNQICGLVDAGVDLRIVCLFQDLNNIHEKVLKYELLDKIYVLKKNPVYVLENIWYSRIQILFDSLPKLFFSFCLSPKFVLDVLNPVKYDELTKSFYLFYLANSFKKIQDLSSYDVLYCQFGPWGKIGAAFKRLGLFNGSVITAFRGYGINVIPKSKPKDFYKLLIRNGDAYTANTNDTKIGARKLGFPDKKIHIVHSTLNIDEFEFKERKLAKSDDLILLSVGSLVPIKGHSILIRALNKLKSIRPDLKFRLEIVGDGPLKNELAKLINDLDMNDQVKLVGFKTQDKLKSMYFNAHILIHPSVETIEGSKEAQGLVIQEAQATGLPVIASNIGGIPEGLIEHETGLLVPSNDSEALAKAIISVYNNYIYWARQYKAGREFIRLEFDVKVQTDKLIALFEKILVKT